MPPPEIARARPQRWDRPFGDGMTDPLVDRLLRIEPFASADPAAFPRATPLRGLVRNDTRVVRIEAGRLVFREGDYGGSAFLVLDGTLRVALEGLAPRAAKKEDAPQAGGWGRAVAQLLGRASRPEDRAPLAANPTHDDDPPGVFVQDIPAVLDSTHTARLGPGEVFGELGALTRSPRSASVFAETDAVLLEIRWQGLRDLMRYAAPFAEHLHAMYRKNSLSAHLRQTPLFAGLDEGALARVGEAITFESFGSFDRHEPRAPGAAPDPLEQARREPVVVAQGEPVDSVLLVRNGFVRMTTDVGQGRRTVAYLGRGRVAGAEEAFVGRAMNEPAVWRRSLLAVGYVDLLRLPLEVFLAEVAPTLPARQTERWLARSNESNNAAPGAAAARRLDFLVDHRLVNGAEAMVIDLERCTRCDDCVRACAATHEGLPRFVRQGPTLDALQFAEACMHCVDPVCMIGCPTGAIHRDEQSGVVRVNESTCIGCSTCANSCPWGNIQMNEVREPGGAIVVDQATGQPLLRASKCDLCVGRNTGPACQHACPHDALVRIDLTESAPLAQWSGS